MSTSQREERNPGTMFALVASAAASIGWATFMWRSLIAARQGAETFCAFGASNCAALWDGPFASWIHRVTTIPVAGWGVIWGIVALVVPLLVLLGKTRLGPLGELLSAIKLTAAAGLVGVAILAFASYREGGFCSNCAITYALTLAYGAIAFVRLPKGTPLVAERGVFSAVLLTVLAYAALLYPGLNTPRASSDAARQALERATEDLKPQPASSSTVASSGADEDELLHFLGELPDNVRATLAKALVLHRNAPARPTDPPRVAFGNPEAPVIITEFSDFLCSHCAELHETLRSLLDKAGTRFGVDARQFPLDGHCNAELPVRGPETVRCLAAKVAICMEGKPNRFEMSSDLFAAQRTLTTEKLLEISSGYIDQMSLDACLTDPATERKLADDVAYAGRHNPTGTPLILVNGRQASNYGPLLLALVLAQGDADHPAFSTLPSVEAGP